MDNRIGMEIPRWFYEKILNRQILGICDHEGKEKNTITSFNVGTRF